jgi:dTMP kinase
MFFSLDGIDGAGKSTQMALLADWLRAQGRDVVVTRDPGGTGLGDRIRSLLLDSRGDMDVRCEMFLYMASRSQLVAEVIRPALLRGQVVLCDRYLLANVVYQGHAGGLDPATLWQVGALATQRLEPDLACVLDLPAKEAYRRKSGPGDRMEQKGLPFMEQVRAGFLAEARRRPDRIRIIDAQRSIAQVQADIQQEVSRVLAGRT